MLAANLSLGFGEEGLQSSVPVDALVLLYIHTSYLYSSTVGTVHNLNTASSLIYQASLKLIAFCRSRPSRSTRLFFLSTKTSRSPSPDDSDRRIFREVSRADLTAGTWSSLAERGTVHRDRSAVLPFTEHPLQDRTNILQFECCMMHCRPDHV